MIQDVNDNKISENASQSAISNATVNPMGQKQAKKPEVTARDLYLRKQKVTMRYANDEDDV